MHFFIVDAQEKVLTFSNNQKKDIIEIAKKIYTRMRKSTNPQIIPISQQNVAYFHSVQSASRKIRDKLFVGLSALTPESSSGQAIVNSKFAMRHFELQIFKLETCRLLYLYAQSGYKKN